MADQSSSSLSRYGSNALADATTLQCKCKLPQQFEKNLQTQGKHYKKLSPKSRGHSLPLSPLLNNLNLYSKKPPSGFYSNKDVNVTSSFSNKNTEPSFRIGGKTDHYPGKFSFTNPRFFLANPEFSSAGAGGLHAEERLDIMSENYRAFDHNVETDGNEPIFYVGSSNACENINNLGHHGSSQPTNSFTNSISRRRKLTQSLSGISSPGPVRNKLSPVREYVPSTSSNADSPTTPTNPMVCCTKPTNKFLKY